MRNFNCVLLSMLFFFIPMAALAGDLDSPAAPTSAGSAMYTLEAIYNRLNAGTAGAKRAGAFTEPSAGPTAGTGHTLDDVMGKAPSVDDTDGAGVADVSNGKKFWGLKSDEWGLKTGTGTIVTDPAPIAKTGLTACYNATGGVTDCSDSGDWPGQDAYWAGQGIGVTLPDPRLTDNGDGTVTDNLTGLMWLEDANKAGETKNWADALTYCSGLDDSGHSDWRLPNIKELLSLSDYGQSNPALPASHPFDNVQEGHYWSSTTRDYDKTKAWDVRLYYGDMSNVIKTMTYYVWPVRGGQ